MFLNKYFVWSYNYIQRQKQHFPLERFCNIHWPFQKIAAASQKLKLLSITVIELADGTNIHRYDMGWLHASFSWKTASKRPILRTSYSSVIANELILLPFLGLPPPPQMSLLFSWTSQLHHKHLSSAPVETTGCWALTIYCLHMTYVVRYACTSKQIYITCTHVYKQRERDRGEQISHHPSVTILFPSSSWYNYTTPLVAQSSG